MDGKVENSLEECKHSHRYGKFGEILKYYFLVCHDCGNSILVLKEDIVKYKLHGKGTPNKN